MWPHIHSLQDYTPLTLQLLKDYNHKPFGYAGSCSLAIAKELQVAHGYEVLE